MWWTADNRADLHRDWHIVAPMQLDSTPSHLPTLPLRFGTPLTENAIRVMMLGSGALGQEVVIALQRLGVEVIRGEKKNEEGA